MPICGEQAANGSGDQADHERHKGCNRNLNAGVNRKWIEADYDNQKYDGQADQQGVKSYLIGRLLPDAPSTRAIILSRKEPPGSAAILIFSQSDTTVVPPVTDEKSPPASRVTGADSPVIADSSTEFLRYLSVIGYQLIDSYNDNVPLLLTQKRKPPFLVRRS